MKRWACRDKESVERMMDVQKAMAVYFNNNGYLERIESDTKPLFFMGVVFDNTPWLLKQKEKK